MSAAELAASDDHTRASRLDARSPDPLPCDLIWCWHWVGSSHYQASMYDNSQLQLGLPALRRWGGHRPGAGRKPGPRRRVPHLRREVGSARTPYHVTLRVRHGLPSLRLPGVVRELERTFRAASDRGAFRLVHYSIQRDHVHLVVEAERSRDLARGMMSVGARLARNRAAEHRVPTRRSGSKLAPARRLVAPRTDRSARGPGRTALIASRDGGATSGSRAVHAGALPPSTGLPNPAVRHFGAGARQPPPFPTASYRPFRPPLGARPAPVLASPRIRARSRSPAAPQPRVPAGTAGRKAS